MEVKIIEVEISAKVKVGENDKGLVFCEIVPPSLTNELTFLASKAALEEYDEDADFEYLDTIGGRHFFERSSITK